ncbi:hypothetical protein Tco_0533767 [Tanacetum coccineum]
MDHDVNDAIGKEFDGESGNSGKLPLLEWNQSSQARKDGTVVDNDFCDFDSYNEFLPPWSAEIMITNRTKRLIDEFEFKKLLAEIDYVFGLENSSQDSLEFPYEIDFEQEMEELLNYGPNEVDFEQRMEELLYYDTDDGASISGRKGILRLGLVMKRGCGSVEMVAEEMVVEKAVDGNDGGDVVSDGDAIPDELYAAIVAQEGVFSADDGDVIPDELYGVIVAQEGVFLGDSLNEYSFNDLINVKDEVVAEVVAQAGVGPVDDGDVIPNELVTEEIMEDQTRSIKRRKVMADKENEDDGQWMFLCLLA